MSDTSTLLTRTLLANADGAFTTNKGLSCRCPFCLKESSRGREKFLVFINDAGLYTGHHCFVCNASGSGVFGLGRIFEMIGHPRSIMDLDDMCHSSDRMAVRSPADAPTVALTQWPPAWIETDDEIEALASDYLIGRGISNAGPLLKKYNCVASRVVMTSRGSVMPYNCIVWPMEDKDGTVVGWASRAIGEPREGLPKSLGMTGAGWKEISVFGASKIDPRLPVTVVEGFASSLATPNSVATCGKAISTQQINLIAGLNASHIILALDPDVKSRDVLRLETAFIMAAPNAEISVIPWSVIDAVPGRPYGKVGGDPADRGAQIMSKIIITIMKGDSFE